MKYIKEINKDLADYAKANNYHHLMVTYGYIFHQVLGNDRLRFMAISNDAQIILDFGNQIFYRCEKYTLLSIGQRIPDLEFKKIISLYNKEIDLFSISGIVNICLYYNLA